MKSINLILPLCIFILVIFVPTVSAQSSSGDDFIMLEEITIKVEAERPTVVVTIPRKDPQIQIGELKRPEEAKILDKPSSVRPRLSDLEIVDTKKHKIILAKER